jgi:hypothetical protein
MVPSLSSTGKSRSATELESSSFPVAAAFSSIASKIASRTDSGNDSSTWRAVVLGNAHALVGSGRFSRVLIAHNVRAVSMRGAISVANKKPFEYHSMQLVFQFYRTMRHGRSMLAKSQERG